MNTSTSNLPVEDKGEYVVLHISGLEYEVPKEIYEKMQKSKK